MAFVNGQLQAEFMARVRGVDPQRCLVVPVDVGKRGAMALVADHYGKIVVPPFEFALNETGFAQLTAEIARAEAARDAAICRVGVESAGHYHRTLAARLRAVGLEVVELNPSAVKEARSQQLMRRLKSDARDCGAMAELLVRGSGRPPQQRTAALATQAAWVAHRRRKILAQTALSNQIHAGLDLVFPGLTGCFSHGLEGVSLRVIMREIPDPDRVRRLGVDGLVRFVRRRGARITQAKAAQIVETARQVLKLPEADWNAASAVLAADVTFFFALEEEITKATAELSTVLPDTPAGVLTPPANASGSPHPNFLAALLPLNLATWGC
ncbi:IS110 family transposase [Streptomyces triculaminicus]|uniref:IS110 family transposase n=1 Tax=Streptomyces triculaminicus TaxID=2816232 RepID=UPI0037D358FA